MTVNISKKKYLYKWKFFEFDSERKLFKLWSPLHISFIFFSKIYYYMKKNAYEMNLTKYKTQAKQLIKIIKETHYLNFIGILTKQLTINKNKTPKRK